MNPFSTFTWNELSRMKNSQIENCGDFVSLAIILHLLPWKQYNENGGAIYSEAIKWRVVKANYYYCHCSRLLLYGQT